ncbi:DUF2167 domain-containing protein [Nannocystis sp. ILAH1]|uniref:DUF2167 domain-containing protein n=1 Tax=Nannocystis sp. ILAH1 TaxID=2996789 RepID=UPI00226FD032|nr:DUF2167 domain-containing protein [Nannocystis sp. ILAH1]MCY0990145.1 DUF2167 domain-containing protein [Nannocystis sp. ILAH1]
MKHVALVLGALLAGAPLIARATVFEDGNSAAAPPAGAAQDEAPPPGWDALSPAQQEKLAAIDEAGIQALAAKLDRGETLTDDEKLIAEGLATLMSAEFDSKLTYQTGDIKVGDGLATLHLGEDYRFLGPADARRVIEEAWHNPPGEQPLGMIVPAKLSPADPRGWGVVVSYVEEGHVDDADAASIDYDELLTQMKEATEKENESRKAMGFPAMHLVGWAEPPHYDQSRHSLYWAKELGGDEGGENSLNYAVRVLGRKGVLELNAVSGMTQLPQIRPEMETIYGRVEFDDGNRYSDFNPDIDTVAAYGIGGLIAGKLAAKAGLFALLAKGGKFIVLAIVGLFAGIRAWFTRKKE